MMRLVTTILLAAALMAPDAQAEPSCDPDRIHCSDPNTWPIWQWDFSVQVGSTYTLETSDLTNNGDTVMWLLNLETGQVQALDDDGNTGTANPLDSRIVHTPTRSYAARIVVAAFTTSSVGGMSVSVRKGAIEQLPVHLRSNQGFGGFQLPFKDVRAGDRLLVGALPSDLYWNRLYVFSSNSLAHCDANCGSFRRREEGHTTGLSLVTMDATWAAARVLVGTGSGNTAGTRFMHVRRASSQGGNWSGATHLDNDGDTLTWELESLLGTCDTATGPAPDCMSCALGFPPGCPAGSCRCFADRSGFQPADTDNDGLDDLTEVFGRQTTCPNPEAPFYMRSAASGADQCQDTTITGCTMGAACQVWYGIAMSALGADPREVDAFVELDAIATAGDDGFLSAWEKTEVEDLYGQEGFECEQNESTDPQQCPGELDRYRRVKVHIYDSELRTPVKINKGWTGFVAGWYIKHFSSWRRYTNTFRYALATTAGPQGQGEPDGRWLIFGSAGGSSSATATTFSHELGHNLGLLHGGFEDPYKINHPSVMNYGYWYSTFTRKAPDPAQVPNPGRLWPPDFGLPCTSAQDCPISGRCHPATQKCHVQCWTGNFRLSRGTNISLVETNLQELGVGQKLAAEVVCQNDAPSSVNPFDATCNGVPYCKINWDQGESPPGTPEYANGPQPGVDLKVDGALKSTAFTDNDDWQRIYDRARFGVDDDCCDKTYTWLGQMEGDASDISGGDEHATTAGTVQFTASGVPSYDTAYGLSADLDGPGFSDAIVLQNTPLQSSIAAKVAGRGAYGLTFSAFVNLRDVNFSGAHQIIDARPFLDVYVTNGSTFGTLTATLNTGAAPVTATVVGRNGWMFPGTWYWVVVWWDQAELRAYVVPWVSDTAGKWKWDFTMGACSRASALYAADSSTGTIRIGAHRDTPLSRSLRGRIDEVALINYEAKSLNGIIEGVSCN